MGFDAFKDKVSEKVSDVLGNEEQVDQGLNTAENFVNEKTGGKFEGQVGQGRDFIDGKIHEHAEGDKPADS